VKREALIEGIWERDATTWTGSDEAHWLGWLDEPLHVQEGLDEIRRFAESLHDEVDDVVLCGMGGSSLAPEVLRRSFDVDWFHVLDTTHPNAIRTLEEKLDLERTLFVSSS
jgi:transaldolase/glucose-6-phosphate isomerase